MLIVHFWTGEFILSKTFMENTKITNKYMKAIKIVLIAIAFSVVSPMIVLADDYTDYYGDYDAYTQPYDNFGNVTYPYASYDTMTGAYSSYDTMTGAYSSYDTMTGAYTSYDLSLIHI